MNKRYLFLLTLTFIIIIPTCAFAFSDVEGHWAEETINKMQNYGIVNGYSGDFFKPDEHMTRAELITVIDKLIGLQSETDKYIPDVTSKEWFYSNVRKALFFGIIQGDENGNIHPNSFVTREEAVLILSRAFQLYVDESNFGTSFEDEKDISSWSKKEFVAFVRKQYINGYEDNTLRPKGFITRAEIMTIINRITKNILVSSLTKEKLNGNTLVKDKNMIFNNIEIYGDLIIGENSANTVEFKNVIVSGNLITYAPINLTKNTMSIHGQLINVYDNKKISNLYYKNDEYGISFSVPDGTSTYTGTTKELKDSSKNDLIVVNMQKKDDYYFESIAEISSEKIKELAYDSIFSKIESGEIQSYPYELYADNTSSHLLIIKRDNIAYTLLFLNVVSDNIIDSVISNLNFVAGSEVENHETLIYKNSKLSLKFNYKNGYVGVDDSYNTNVVYSGDSIFKMFIQVNMITDMNEYSLEEIKSLLKTLIVSDGEIISEEITKINTHDAIRFEIASEDSKIISLYVIIGNNLYNFIFKGDSNTIDSIGKEMFWTIVNSMEF